MLDLALRTPLAALVALAALTTLAAAGASIEGDLHVASVEIRGEFEGRIIASKVAQLGRTAKAKGSILAPQIVMADGAAFKGVVETADEPGGESEK